MEKDEIRRTVLARRDALDANKREIMSERICRFLLEDPAVEEADSIFVFVSFGSEVDTHPLLRELLARKKIVAVPYTERGNPIMSAVRLEDYASLVEGHYGILSPHPDIHIPIDPHEINTVIVPGVAFDDYGHRIGYGAGYYDRYLSLMPENALRIGICFSVQRISRIPAQPTDIAVHRLFTEHGECALRKER